MDITAVFDDTEQFSETFLYIFDKKQNKIKLKLNSVQRHYLQNKKQHNLILKARQFGMSTVITADLFRIATTQRASVGVLAHDDDSTQLLRRMANRFYENMPKDFRPTRKYANDRLTSYPDFDSEIFIASAGSLNKGRGGTFSHLHGSEVAFWPDAEKLVSGIMQAGDPFIVLESTPNGAQGYFYNLVMESLDGNSDWNLMFYEWWYDGQYQLSLDKDEIITPVDDEIGLIEKQHLTLEQIKWRRKKQKQLKGVFLQEYPEDPKTCFLLSGIGYFGNIDHCFIDLNHNYNPDYKYYAGLDFGQTVDYTVLSVICKNTKQQVALLRLNKLPWSEMRRQIVLLCKKFNVKMLWAEKNSMGTTNIEELRKEFYEQDQKTRIKEFLTTNNSKHEIMTELHEALHEDGLTLLDIKTPEWSHKREFQAFISKQTSMGIWQLQAAEGEHDDCVIAAALSWQASIKSGSGFG